MCPTYGPSNTSIGLSSTSVWAVQNNWPSSHQSCIIKVVTLQGNNVINKSYETFICVMLCRKHFSQIIVVVFAKHRELKRLDPNHVFVCSSSM